MKGWAERDRRMGNEKKTDTCVRSLVYRGRHVRIEIKTSERHVLD